jgi:hypothetical protein
MMPSSLSPCRKCIVGIESSKNSLSCIEHTARCILNTVLLILASFQFQTGFLFFVLLKNVDVTKSNRHNQK